MDVPLSFAGYPAGGLSGYSRISKLLRPYYYLSSRRSFRVILGQEPPDPIFISMEFPPRTQVRPHLPLF